MAKSAKKRLKKELKVFDTQIREAAKKARRSSGPSSSATPRRLMDAALRQFPDIVIAKSKLLNLRPDLTNSAFCSALQNKLVGFILAEDEVQKRSLGEIRAALSVVEKALDRCGHWTKLLE